MEDRIRRLKDLEQVSSEYAVVLKMRHNPSCEEALIKKSLQEDFEPNITIGQTYISLGWHLANHLEHWSTARAYIERYYDFSKKGKLYVNLEENLEGELYPFVIRIEGERIIKI